jgi:hypothetical protein
MSDPPDGQKKHQQVPIEVISITDCTALYIPSSTFGILERGFDAHPPPIYFDELASRRQVGNHDPDFFISWFPTDSQRGGKAVLFPKQCFAVPLEPFFAQKLSSQLPIRIAALELTTHQMLLGDAEHVMPLNLLANPDQFEATQSAISE